MEQIDFGKLQQEVSESLIKAQRVRFIMQCVQIPTYLLAFGWLLFMPFAGYLLGGDSEAATQGTTIPVVAIIAFFLFFIGAGCLMGWAYQYSKKKEKAVMNHLVKTLFPSAKYHNTPVSVNYTMVKNSRFFSFDRNVSLEAQTFGSLEMNIEGRRLVVADIGVRKASNDSVGGYLTLLLSIWRMIMGERADNAMTQFRGMFTWVDMEKQIPGSVIVLPDHIEGKLGYLAKNLQNLKNSKTEKLVMMEDPLFERYYAVYSTDEVLARYILTPAMMTRLTGLRERFGRDVMVSFSRNRFCCAVSTPDGFLTLRGKAIRNGHFVEEIYEEISAAADLCKELRLDKIVKQ